MKKYLSLFLFLASLLVDAETVQKGLPKDFTENADFFSKMEMIENLSAFEQMKEEDFQKDKRSPASENSKEGKDEE